MSGLPWVRRSVAEQLRHDADVWRGRAEAAQEALTKLRRETFGSVAALPDGTLRVYPPSEDLIPLIDVHEHPSVALAAELRADLDEVTVERDELLQALDMRRPAPDRWQLGLVIERQWYRQALPDIPTTEAWARVADTAIDFVRGLWPLDPPDGAGQPVGKPSPEAAGERASGGAPWPYTATPETSPGGGVGGACVSTGAEPGEASTPGDPDLSARADDLREQLAQALAANELDLTGGRWATTHDHFRGLYLRLADAVILAGWRPPAGQATSAQLPVVARVLTDHELLADDTCRCGWASTALWHAEHVAEQLVATGALTIPTGARP